MVANINQLEDIRLGVPLLPLASPSPIPDTENKTSGFCSFYPVSYEDHSN